MRLTGLAERFAGLAGPFAGLAKRLSDLGEADLEPDLFEPEDVEVPEEEDEEVLPDAVPLVPDDEGERRDGMASIKTQIASAVSNVIKILTLSGFPRGI